MPRITISNRGISSDLRRCSSGGEQSIPESSSVPAPDDPNKEIAVKVSLPPGSSVKPEWAFQELVTMSLTTDSSEGDDPSGGLSARMLPAEFLRQPNDTREQLAANITSPHNRRFAQVLVNRIWQRYMGRGLVEPLYDWESIDCTHPELLEALADDLIASGYDLKEISRKILGSNLYQRMAINASRSSDEAKRFAGPLRRRMTAEQLTDSLLIASGKDYDSEELTMDADGRQAQQNFVKLGHPRRAWQFVTVSNERDRPSLNLPVAQSVVDLLSAYGWRQNRQDPLTERESATTPLQPLALAYGTTANRMLDFSDHSELTALALESDSAESFIDQLFIKLLTRMPSSEERDLFLELLAPGFNGRIVAGPEAVRPKRIFRSGVTWANHFDPKSDNEVMARERDILNGDPPTARLETNWRERAEDAAWTLVNSPEFVFVP